MVIPWGIPDWLPSWCLLKLEEGKWDWELRNELVKGGDPIEGPNIWFCEIVFVGNNKGGILDPSSVKFGDISTSLSMQNFDFLGPRSCWTAVF